MKRLSTAARAWRCACPCLLLAAVTAHANPQSSASYAIDPDTTDLGGGRSVSALYANHGSVAEITGVSTVAAPPETANHSYIGQLSDITALQLHAAPLTAPEDAFLQLSAAAVLDDLTTIPLAAHQITWSALSGPVATISATGLATTDVVYQDTAASVQGRHAGLTGSLNLTVLDSIADNFGLYAGDGLGDAWQAQYFGIANANAAPLLDPDHDGWINLFEHNAGLVPTDPQSGFHFREKTVPGQPNQRRIIFSPRLPGSTYTVMASTTSAAGSWQPLTGAITTDNGSERTVTDTDATGPRKFYQIEVQKP